MKGNLLSIFLLLLWKYCCDFLYVLTFPTFKYYGIKLEPSFNKLVETYFYLIIIAFIYVYTKYRNSGLLILILIIFQYIPLSTYYAHADENSLYFRFVSFLFIILAIFNKLFVFKLKFVNSINISISKLIFFSFIGIIVLIITNGLPNSDSFNFLNVYSRRAKFISNSLLEYVNSFNLYVITPILFLYALRHKNYKFLYVAVFYNSFYFLVSGGKYAFFLLFLIPIFYKLARLEQLKSIVFVISGLLISLTITYHLSLNFGFDFIFNELFFRTFIVPAWLSFVYVNYFNSSNFYRFSESFSFLGTKPSISSPELIGEHLFSDQGGSFASNGLWGDAYANFGYVGIVIVFILFSFFLIFVNSLKIKTDSRLLSSFIAINGFSLINTSLLSALASRGLFIGVAIYIFLNYNERKR